jgi:hypothetical protein
MRMNLLPRENDESAIIAGFLVVGFSNDWHL